MEVYFIVLFFIIGVVMGSFFHVVATRLSNDESIMTPGSHCPRCNHFLKWYENIPVISYILQMGKCKSCNSKIPISYLVVEVITGSSLPICEYISVNEGTTYKIIYTSTTIATTNITAGYVIALIICFLFSSLVL